MTKFFKSFMYSKSPNTVLWLLEIMFILTNKFKPLEAKLEK